MNPRILGLRALPATAPSVFVKIRSPNDGPRRLGHPHGQKNLLRSPRLTFLSRRPNFDQNIKFIHSLGWGLLFRVGTKNANNNFLCPRLAETGGAMTHNTRCWNIHYKTTTTRTRTIKTTTTPKYLFATLTFCKLKGH